MQPNTWVASRLHTPQLNSRAWGTVTLVAWRWLQVECFFFCWGGHKSCQVAAFTFSTLLARAIKTLRDAKGQLLLLSSLCEIIICLCCRGFSSDRGWLTQRQAETCQQWVWQETSYIKDCLYRSYSFSIRCNFFWKKKNPLIMYFKKSALN